LKIGNSSRFGNLTLLTFLKNLVANAYYVVAQKLELTGLTWFTLPGFETATLGSASWRKLDKVKEEGWTSN
jgi:hypothetical protein